MTSKETPPNLDPAASSLDNKYMSLAEFTKRAKVSPIRSIDAAEKLTKYGLSIANSFTIGRHATTLIDREAGEAVIEKLKRTSPRDFQAPLRDETLGRILMQVQENAKALKRIEDALAQRGAT